MKLFVEKEEGGVVGPWLLAQGLANPLLLSCKNNPARLQHLQATVSTALWLTAPQEDTGSSTLVI